MENALRILGHTLGHWPIPMATLLCSTMIVITAEDTVTLPDWLSDAFTRQPEAPDDQPTPQPEVVAVPFAPVPGWDDRTPLPYVSQVFDLADPALPGKLSGIGPVFWKHGGHGSGSVIAPDLVLTTAHLFVQDGKWHGPLGLSPKPPAPADGRIYLEACGESYAFSEIHLGSLAPRGQLGLDYAIARLERPVCAAARIVSVAATPEDVSARPDDVLLSLGAHPVTDLPRYKAHPLFEGLSSGEGAFSVFGVRCAATGREDTGAAPGGSTAVIVTEGCDAVPGASGGGLLLSRDGGESYNLIGVTNSYRPDTEYNNYTRIEGAFAAHLAQFIPVTGMAESSAAIADALPAPIAKGPWLPMAAIEAEDAR